MPDNRQRGFDVFSERVVRVFEAAEGYARIRRSRHIKPEDLLLAIVRLESGAAARLFMVLDVDRGEIRSRLESVMDVDAEDYPGSPVLDRFAKRAIRSAVNEARLAKLTKVDTSHLLLGLLALPEGLVADILREHSVTRDRIRGEEYRLETISKMMPEGNRLYYMLSLRSRRVLEDANGYAYLRHRRYTTPEHLLLALLGQEAGVAARLFEVIGVDRDAMRLSLESYVDREVEESGEFPILDSLAKAAVGRAVDEALPTRRGDARTSGLSLRSFQQQKVGTLHLLLGLLSLREGHVAGVLREHSVTLDRVRDEVRRFTSSERVTSASAGEYDVLSRGSQRVLKLAQQEARRLNQRFVRPMHILLALLREGDGGVAQICTGLGADRDGLRLSLESASEREVEWSAGDPMLDADAIEAIDRGLRIAQTAWRGRVARRGVEAEHLLLGLLREPGERLAELLGEHSVTLDGVRERLCCLTVGSGAMADDGDRASRIISAPIRQMLRGVIEDASRGSRRCVTTGRILLALLRDDGGVAVRVLTDLGADVDGIRSGLESLVDGEDDQTDDLAVFDSDAERAVSSAIDEARASVRVRLVRVPVEPEHLLLSTLYGVDAAVGAVCRGHSLSADRVRSEMPRVAARPGASYCMRRSRALPTNRNCVLS